MSPGSFQRSCLDERSASEVVVENGFAISFKNRLGRHGEGGEIGWSCEVLEGSVVEVSAAIGVERSSKTGLKVDSCETLCSMRKSNVVPTEG